MSILDRDRFRHYIESFNALDEELVVQHVGNADAWSFLRANIPFFECPDKDLEEIYYFRWWTFRKHLKQTPDGFVITEFLPAVPWAGKHNTISCAAGHHFREGRWLRDPRYLDDYARFWFRRGGEPRRYSFWAASALYDTYQVRPNLGLLADLLTDLVANYRAWEMGRPGGIAAEDQAHLDANGLFWQSDGRDGMEVSIGGPGYRPTINSYMYGDALAIAAFAELGGASGLADQYAQRARRIKALVEQSLWNEQREFFETLSREPEPKAVCVRELHGYTPWYFSLPDAGYEVAWRQLIDSDGFRAPFGPTTAEQRHPSFAVAYVGHECQWNGPSWPYSTAITLTALANLLNHYQQDVVNRDDYFDLLRIYTRSHRLHHEAGRTVPWIDENLDPFTGEWIARKRLKSWKDGTWDPVKGGRERGKDYNHSTYCDLIITGLVGLRPRSDGLIEINSLLPQGSWDYFCLDHVSYHGHSITILYDRTGQRYHRGAGLRVYADDREVAFSTSLQRIVAGPLQN